MALGVFLYLCNVSEMHCTLDTENEPQWFELFDLRPFPCPLAGFLYAGGQLIHFEI